MQQNNPETFLKAANSCLECRLSYKLNIRVVEPRPHIPSKCLGCLSGAHFSLCPEEVPSEVIHYSNTCTTFGSVQPLSHVWRFATPWTTARQASLVIANSRSLLKPMSIESVMPCNHLIFFCPLLLPPSIVPSIRVNESVLASGGQSIGVSDSASVLPMNIQDWSPLGWTGWISLQSKGLSRVFSNTTVQKQ